MKQLRKIATLTAIVGALWLGGCEENTQSIPRIEQKAIPYEPPGVQEKKETIEKVKCHPGCPPENGSLTIDLTSVEIQRYPHRPPPDTRYIGQVIGCLEKHYAAVLFETRGNNYPQELEGEDLLLYLLTNETIKQETNFIVDSDGDGKVDVTVYGFDRDSKYVLPEQEILKRTPEFEFAFLAPDEAMYEFRQYLRRRK